MQNVCFHVFRSFIVKTVACRLFFLASACAFLGLCIGLTGAPSAYAATYSCPSVTIKAVVAEDGSLMVTESRQFRFSSSSDYVIWYLENPSPNGELQVLDVSLRRNALEPNNKVASRIHLEEVPFQPDYPKVSSPGNDVFAVDPSSGRACLFFNADTETVEVTVRYLIVNGVACYKDAAQVYWKYVSPEWPVAAQNVSASFRLPVPAGQKVEEGENVYAWGHGPLDGRLKFTSKGAIRYESDQVNAGQFAEARIIFPVEWITSSLESAAELRDGNLNVDNVIRAEARWADKANWLRLQDIAFAAAAFALAVLVLLWAVWMLRRWGMEPKPREGDCDPLELIADDSVDAAVMARLCRWNEPSKGDFPIVLAQLVALGFVEVHQGNCQAGSVHYQGLYLTRASQMPEKGGASLEMTPAQRCVFDFLFHEVSQDGVSLWLDEIGLHAARHPQASKEFRKRFDQLLSLQVEKSGFFDGESPKRKNLLRVVSGAYCALSIAYALAIGSLLPLLGILVSLALLLMSHLVGRRTQKGIDVFAAAQHLKERLRSVDGAEEACRNLVAAQSANVECWSRLLICALSLESLSHAIEGMRACIPDELHLVEGQEEGEPEDDALRRFRMLVLLFFNSLEKPYS